MMWNTDNPYLYLRATSDKRMIISGRDERVSHELTREIMLAKKTGRYKKISAG